MTTVANRPTLHSDVVKADFMRQHDYTREMKTLTLAAFSQTAPHGVELGQVYAADGTITVAADVTSLETDGTTPLYILLDDSVYTDGHAAAADVSCAVMKQGPAIVIREQLKFGDALTSGQVDTVVSVLESQGIEVRSQY